MQESSRASGARWSEGSNARIAHAIAIALLHQAALVVPLVAIAPSLTGEVNPFDAPPAAFVLLAIIVFLQAGVVVGMGLLRWGRLSLRDLGWHGETIARDVGRGLIGFALVAAIVSVSQWARGGGAAVLEAGRTIAGYSMAQRALFFGIGLVAAFGEESIFRGYLQPTLMKRFGAAGGVLVTAAFFSVYHLQFTPPRLLGLFLFGLVYGVLRGRDQSLVAPALAHCLCWAALGAL